MDSSWYARLQDKDDRKVTEGDAEASAADIVSICDALGDSGERKARWMAALALYEGRQTFKLDGLVTEASVESEDIYNLSASAVDTAQAEIAARQRPKGAVITSGSDYRLRRRAKKLDKFAEAWLHQQHGIYADAWELCEDAFRVASIAVGAVIKVCADPQAEKIRIEHIPQDEIRVDPEEAKRGDPQQWFHVYEMDLDLAINAFCNEKDDQEGNQKREAALRASVDSSAKLTRGGAQVARSVRIYEAYRIAIDDETPGVQAYACSHGMLWFGDWRWDSPPWRILVWNRECFGVWGRGLVEEGAVQHDLVNRMAQDMHERVRLCASKRTYYVPGTIEAKYLEENEAEVFIPCTDLANVPREVNAPPIQNAEMEVLRDDIQRYYDMRGISQMSASSRKESGVDAAVAMQTLNDIKSVRFLPKARAYELLFAGITRLIIRAAQDMADHSPGLLAKFPGAEFIDEIEWSKVSLEDSMYEVRVAPVSSMSKDPAQRLQVAQLLLERGSIGEDKYKELLGMPDLDSVLDEETAESRYVAMLLNRYRDAEDDEELDQMGGFEDAEGYLLNPLGALALSAQHYWEAKLEGAPRFNLSLLRRWMSSLESAVAKRAPKPPAQPATPPAGAPPGAQPGAPPSAAQPPQIAA